jgi:dolichol-phosphate mannosyltransferase
MEKKLVSIVIPVFNESDNVPLVVQELNKILGAITEFDCEVIFVDDGSKDDSFEKLKVQPFGNYKVQLIKLSKNYGAHAAVRAGILSSKGDYITNLTADLQDSPELPLRLFKKMQEGYDLVWAIRRTTKVSFAERTFSKFFASLMKKYAFKDYPESGLDIFMMNSKVREQLNKNIEANSSLQLQIFSLGYRQARIEYDKEARKRGKSKWTMAKKIKLLVDSFVAFSFMPIRLVTIVGFLFFSFGILWTIYISVRKIFVGDVVSGWPMLTSILLLGFGITNISLGIIAEYLWRTLDASRKRPVFIIDEIVKINEQSI